MNNFSKRYYKICNLLSEAVSQLYAGDHRIIRAHSGLYYSFYDSYGEIMYILPYSGRFGVTARAGARVDQTSASVDNLEGGITADITGFLNSGKMGALSRGEGSAGALGRFADAEFDFYAFELIDGRLGGDVGVVLCQGTKDNYIQEKAKFKRLTELDKIVKKTKDEREERKDLLNSVWYKFAQKDEPPLTTYSSQPNKFPDYGKEKVETTNFRSNNEALDLIGNKCEFHFKDENGNETYVLPFEPMGEAMKSPTWRQLNNANISIYSDKEAPIEYLNCLQNVIDETLDKMTEISDFVPERDDKFAMPPYKKLDNDFYYYSYELWRNGKPFCHGSCNKSDFAFDI